MVSGLKGSRSGLGAALLVIAFTHPEKRPANFRKAQLLFQIRNGCENLENVREKKAGIATSAVAKTGRRINSLANEKDTDFAKPEMLLPDHHSGEAWCKVGGT